MAERTQTGTDAGSARLNGRSLIGVGKHAAVWRAAGGTEVRKRYLGSDRQKAGRYAEGEYLALERARNALAPIRGITCPTPYLVDWECGELVMEHCQALPIHLAIADRTFRNHEAIRHLAMVFGSGLAVLTRELDLDELDFSVRNTLVSRDLSQIVLVDFTSRPERLVLAQDAWKLECSLASFLSSVITYQLHRSTILDITVSKRMRLLAKILISSVSEQQPVDRERVREIAWLYFWRQSRSRGWKRYIWFKTGGAIMFRAMLDGILRGDREIEAGPQQSQLDRP